MVATATPTEGPKNEFENDHTATNPENLAKISPADFEIIGPAEIVENKYVKTAAEHTSSRPAFGQWRSQKFSTGGASICSILF